MIMLLQFSQFSPPLSPIHPAPPNPLAFPPFSSCPWVIHVSSLTSTFPILFSTSSCLFSAYHLYLTFSVPFPLLSPCHSPTDNPPCDLHFCDSVPVLVVCLIPFCFHFFRFGYWYLWPCYHFLFIFLIFSFFLDKSL